MNEYEQAVHDAGYQDHLGDQSEQEFQERFGQAIADEARATLIERANTDAELAKDYIEFCAEFGPHTRQQWVAFLEASQCLLWIEARDQAESELREAIEAQ